ncbi:hypothetical protein cyc_06561 [Cyclospora cayetanensis]|uniref:Uncharacterized protein n=1 Tax=Cyclospora cayetanensis TaxID=88456 RepID=A0A1D3D3D5_9EIME|nr:hypothetical protein cyc_06561 [Cyclospora cayetanensis]
MQNTSTQECCFPLPFEDSSSTYPPNEGGIAHSNMPGVHYDPAGRRWVASWSISSRQVARYFLVSKYGCSNANTLAVLTQFHASCRDSIATLEGQANTSQQQLRMQQLTHPQRGQHRVHLLFVRRRRGRYGNTSLKSRPKYAAAPWRGRSPNHSAAEYSDARLSSNEK